MKTKQNYFLILLCFTLLSCGTTKITTQNNLNADIYINGEHKGRKEVSIRRMGFPKKIEIVAKYQGQTVGTIKEKRRFDGVTFLIGYCTNGPGFLFAWRYPESISIPIAYMNPEDYINPWLEPQKNVWMKPASK
jgi:hypothetical protein